MSDPVPGSKSLMLSNLNTEPEKSIPSMATFFGDHVFVGKDSIYFHKLSFLRAVRLSSYNSNERHITGIVVNFVSRSSVFTGPAQRGMVDHQGNVTSRTLMFVSNFFAVSTIAFAGLNSASLQTIAQDIFPRYALS